MFSFYSRDSPVVYKFRAVLTRRDLFTLTRLHTIIVQNIALSLRLGCVMQMHLLPVLCESSRLHLTSADAAASWQCTWKSIIRGAYNRQTNRGRILIEFRRLDKRETDEQRWRWRRRVICKSFCPLIYADCKNRIQDLRVRMGTTLFSRQEMRARTRSNGSDHALASRPE